MDVQLSDYAKLLPKDARTRYIEKIANISFEDPYNQDKDVFDYGREHLPQTSYPDIVNYLMFAPSPATSEELKCFKSMDAYHHFVSGFIKSVGVKVYGPDIRLVFSRVLHSMKLSLPPAKSWMIVQSTGKVLSAHCDCTAGMGEACSHVGATLFYLDAINKLKDSTTVTGEKAYWVLPSSGAMGGFEVGYREISDIDFTKPETLKKKIDQTICGQPSSSPSSVVNKHINLTPGEDELGNFFQKLSLGPSKPAVLSIVPPYSQAYKPKSTDHIYPTILSELYDPNNIDMNYKELVEMGKNIRLTVTPEQREAVEEATREQASSRVWHRFRTGVVTASRMHAVTHTNINMPAVSLIKSICYPQANKFSSKATSWGCSHEQQALDLYRNHMSTLHTNFRIVPNGLFLSTEFPFIGATPDSMISCDCCGNGCVEVKCPYCHRDDTVEEACSDPKFCLEENVLKQSHPYYTQIQTQMNVCDVNYCDFFLYLEKGSVLQRIPRDTAIWKDYTEKAEAVFRNGILPELLGKCFTRIPKISVQDNSNMEQYCYCKGTINGQLYPCANPDCELKYFHLECLNLKNALKKSWLCPDCRNINNKKPKQNSASN
jgi:hypothetical protein